MTRTNPLAPPSINGLAGDYPAGYLDVDFSYTFDLALTASQMVRDQVVALATDADFVWRAFIVASNTGVFTIRFSDSQGYYLSNGMLPSALFFAGSQPIPFPFFPEIVLPAGGRIGLDIQDLSAAPNTLHLVFRGVKRYKLPG